MKKRNCLVIFSKVPIVGNVKKRLASTVGVEKSLKIYTYLVESLICHVEKGSWDLVVAFYPSCEVERMKRWLACRRLIPQHGSDLGERMKNSFEELFNEGYEKVVLVGSDIPELNSTHVQEAFSSLERADAVIGPALDGGYYLIAFRRDSFVPEAFSGIKWSTSTVFEDTVYRLRPGILSFLEPLRDIDTSEDLEAFSAGWSDGIPDFKGGAG